MISCEEALELMSLELDGLLEEPDRRRLEEHVGQCAACRDLRKDLGEMHQAFPQLEAEVPKDFAQNVLDALPSRRPLWKRPGFRSLAGLAACALLCAGLWQINAVPEPTPAPDRSAAPAVPEPQCAPPLRSAEDRAAGADGASTGPAQFSMETTSGSEPPPPLLQGKSSEYQTSDTPLQKGPPPADRRSVLKYP